MKLPPRGPDGRFMSKPSRKSVPEETTPEGTSLMYAVNPVHKKPTPMKTQTLKTNSKALLKRGASVVGGSIAAKTSVRLAEKYVLGSQSQGIKDAASVALPFAVGVLMATRKKQVVKDMGIGMATVAFMNAIDRYVMGIPVVGDLLSGVNTSVLPTRGPVPRYSSASYTPFEEIEQPAPVASLPPPTLAGDNQFHKGQPSETLPLVALAY